MMRGQAKSRYSPPVKMSVVSIMPPTNWPSGMIDSGTIDLTRRSSATPAESKLDCEFNVGSHIKARKQAGQVLAAAVIIYLAQEPAYKTHQMKERKSYARGATGFFAFNRSSSTSRLGTATMRCANRRNRSNGVFFTGFGTVLKCSMFVS